MKLNGCCCRKLAIFPFNFHKDFVSIFFSSFYFYFTTLLFVETPPTIWFDNKLQSLCEIRRNKRRSKWIIVVCFDFYREHSAEMRIAINCTKSYVGWILFAFRCKQIRKYTWMRFARSVSLWMARFFYHVVALICQIFINYTHDGFICVKLWRGRTKVIIFHLSRYCSPGCIWANNYLYSFILYRRKKDEWLESCDNTRLSQM